jgi:hypothetical protein
MGAVSAARVRRSVVRSGGNGFSVRVMSGFITQKNGVLLCLNALLWLAPKPLGRRLSIRRKPGSSGSWAESATFWVMMTSQTSGHRACSDSIRLLTIRPCPWLTMETVIGFSCISCILRAKCLLRFRIDVLVATCSDTGASVAFYLRAKLLYPNQLFPVRSIARLRTLWFGSVSPQGKGDRSSARRAREWLLSVPACSFCLQMDVVEYRVPVAGCEAERIFAGGFPVLWGRVTSYGRAVHPFCGNTSNRRAGRARACAAPG